MKIGFDVDGVLADFSYHYQDILRQVSGRDLFQSGDAEDAPCWDWDKYRGYTNAERAVAWARIKSDACWWIGHPPLEENVSSMVTMLYELERRHDVYYITNRVGERAKRQTEIWLFDYLRYHFAAPAGIYPTVLIAEHRQKGELAKGLKLDVFLDDNYDNAMDINRVSPETRMYLRTRRYNTQTMIETGPGVFALRDLPPLNEGTIRVKTLGEMLDREIRASNL